MAGLYFVGVLPISYFKNLRFLLETASQWSFGWRNFDAVFLIIAVSLPNVIAVVALARRLMELGVRDLRETANVIALLVLVILMFKIGTNRADSFHVVMALWVPMLSFVYLTKEEATLIEYRPTRTIAMAAAAIGLLLYATKYPLFALMAIPPIYYLAGMRRQQRAETKARQFSTMVLILVALIVVINGKRIYLHTSKGEYSWLKGIVDPPANNTLVDEGTRWVAFELRRAGASCILDLSNNGVINGLTNLPSCTHFMYPVYATSKYDLDILEQVKKWKPTAVVYSSIRESFFMNGVSMHGRFPELTSYLVRVYPYEECNPDYCVRYQYDRGQGGV